MLLFRSTINLKVLHIFTLMLLSCTMIASSRDTNDGTIFNSANIRNNPMYLNRIQDGQNSLEEESDEYVGNLELSRDHAGSNSMSRAGRSGSHRGFRAGNGMWFGPRLGRVQ